MQVTPLCSLQNPLQFRGHNKDHKANQPLIAQLLLSFSYVIVFRIRKSYLCGQKKGVKPLHDTASAKDYFSALKKKGAGSPGKSSPNTHWPPAKKTPIKPLMKSLKKPPYKGRRVHRRGGIIHRFNTPTHTLPTTLTSHHSHKPSSQKREKAAPPLQAPQSFYNKSFLKSATLHSSAAAIISSCSGVALVDSPSRAFNI
jgi:hypothetical protein